MSLLLLIDSRKRKPDIIFKRQKQFTNKEFDSKKASQKFQLPDKPRAVAYSSSKGKSKLYFSRVKT